MAAMKKRNIKLILAFDGTNYSGWQRQNNAVTIQGMLEEKISLMTREEITVHGAGRTDAGVHALGMVANFNTAKKLSTDGFRQGLNSLLPEDIKVISVDDVDENFHARKSAKAKTYIYHMTIGALKLPTERLYATHITGALDLSMMAESLEFLIGEHDFASFEAAGSRIINAKGRGAVRKILNAEFCKENSRCLDFIIKGDGFLRHMVRNIIGTLLLVGKGKISPADFAAIIAARNRTAAGPTAPARGLFLQEVFYRLRK